MRCKYVAVSAALNHHVDDLLAGLVHQIRLNPDRQSELHPHLAGTDGCFDAAKNFFTRIIGRKSRSAFDCDNLWTL